MTLPTRIPLQSVPIAQKSDDDSLYVDFNWYMFLYNLSVQVFGTGNNGSPASPSDLIDFVDLNAESADVLQAYRKISNVQALEALDSEIQSTDIPDLVRKISNIQAMLPDADIGPSLRDLANAILLALDALAPDPIPAAQPSQVVTVGASPFTYTALSRGALSITAGTVSAISIIRQGTTIATGLTAVVIPISRLDQVQITYTGVPTVVFLPS